MAQHHVEILNHVSAKLKVDAEGGFICLILQFALNQFNPRQKREIIEALKFAIDDIFTFADYMINRYPEFYSEDTPYEEMQKKTTQVRALANQE